MLTNNDGIIGVFTVNEGFHNRPISFTRSTKIIQSFSKVDIELFLWRSYKVYPFDAHFLQSDIISVQSTISHVVLKEIVFLLTYDFDFVIQPKKVFVITDYTFIWNVIRKKIQHSFAEKVLLLVNIFVFN